MDSTDGKAATTTSLNAANKNTVPPPQLFPMSQANGGNNEVKGEVERGGGGLSGMALATAGPTSHVNGGNNEVEGEVRGGGDGLSGTALASAGPTSHADCM
jgi:hypothetical protein